MIAVVVVAALFGAVAGWLARAELTMYHIHRVFHTYHGSKVGGFLAYLWHNRVRGGR